MAKKITPKPGDSMIYAADGHVTGKPSLNTHANKLREAVQEAVTDDPRFRTGKNQSGSSYPVPVPSGAYDYNAPYVADVLVPDDDGKHHAVIRRDDGQLVKHGFDYDAEAGTATMDDGDSEETDCTPVYTRALAEHDKTVRASDDSAASSKAKATIKTEAAVESSTEAHAASAKAHESQDPEDHRAAAEAHSAAGTKHKAAMVAHAKVGNKAKMDEHLEAIKTHDAAACEHGSKCEDEDEEAKASSRSKSDGLVTCKFSSAGKVKADDKAWSLDKPARFMWMPAGVTTVTAGYGEPARPIKLTVECDADTVKVVKSSLADWKKRYPKRENLVCIEHREEARAANPKDFAWNDAEDDGGIYCEALPSGEGVRVVNERIYRDFSPSFLTDAQYSKCQCSECGKNHAECNARECGGTLEFPDGVRGSESNPARVTGVGYSVGSLTNKPAFKNITPVKAREGGPVKEPTVAEQCETILASLARTASPPATNNGAPNEGTTMKVFIIKAHDKFAAGQEVEVDASQAATLIAGGYGQDAVIAAELRKAQEYVKTTNKGRISDAVVRAKSRGAVAPKDDTVLAKAMERFEAGKDSDLLVELIDGMQGQDQTVLAQRLTQALKDNAGNIRIEAGNATLQEEGEAYITARTPMKSLITSGRIKEATALSMASNRHMLPFIKAMNRGEDFSLRDVVKAAGLDVADPDSQVGTLATGLVIMRNLGYLKNKLGWMPYISTDLRNEPVQFAQTVRTRYITPPNLLTYIPGVGYTSDSTTISNASATTTQAGIATQTSGTLTKSAPSTTDVDVKLDQHKGVEIMFSTDKLGSTMRNLFAEQQGAQFYTLAEAVNTFFLGKLFSAIWSGTVSGLSLGANFGLPGMVKIKNRMTLSKLPDTGRFALLHSYYHDGILTDTNLLSAKAILALINKDASAFDSSDVPMLFGVKPLESQLASYNSGTAAPATIDSSGNVTFAGVNQVGFAGNSASAVFVARVPQDYTSALKDIPSTAAIEILTEPDSGLSVMFVKYVNHEKAAVSARCALMYGAAQGDPRQGIVLAP